MIKIYTSNNFNYLIKKICQIMKKKSLKNIFIKEIIIIPELHTSIFIKKIIQKILGIFCNISFYIPEKFIFYILELFIYKIKYKRLDQSYILWKLMNLSVKHQKIIFKKKENTLNKFKYFKNLSKIFYKYFIYNPKLIENFNKNNKNKNKIFIKQKKIWKNINKKFNNQYNYIDLIKNFKKNFIKNKIKYNKLPNRIFILNPIDFPLSYFNIIKTLSKKIKIYFFLYSPYKYINLKKNYLQKSRISNWMKNNLKKMKYILSLTKKININYKNNKKNSLLNIIKNNIFYLNKNIKNKKIKNDNSISIHECYSHLREIEILQENILKILNKNKKIEPKDIIIKTKNIQKYIPYINSVFKSEIKKNNIPYSIYKKMFNKKNQIMFILNKILSLPDSKFKNKKILNFLNFKFISKKFNISIKEIKIIKKWISDTNINWGINKKHKKSFDLPQINQNTWEYGLKKIIIGYGIKKKIWNKIYPYEIYEKKHIKILNKLIYFIKTLIKWKKKLSKKKKYYEWKKIYKKIINDFFFKHKKIKKYLKFLKKKWISLIKEIKNSSYKKKISIKIIKYEINNKIKNFINPKKKKKNSIIFSNFDLFRTIPFKITYILGMNNNFPKKKIKNKDDLIKLNNNNKKYIQDNKKDYFIFLELLSCTTEKIIISYINDSFKNKKNNKESIIINQFKKYIQENFLKKNQFKNLLLIHTKYSFYKKNFYNNSNFKSFNSIWNISSNKKKIKNNLLKKKIFVKNIKNIKIKNLILFWKNPIKYFFHKILNIFYKKNFYKNSNYEPFYIDEKNNYLLNEKILNYIILKKNLKKLFKKIKCLGILPYGNLGKIYFYSQIKKNNNIFLKIKKLISPLKKKRILIKIKNYNIYGSLKNISNLNGVLRWKSFNLNYFDKLSFWIEHLIYCINGGKYNSKYIGFKNKIIFKNIKKKKAKKYLLRYIFGYIQGLKNPLLLINSGFTWFHYIYNKKNKKISKNKKIKKWSKQKMFEIWNGNTYFQGEKKNLYIKKFLKSMNKKNMKKIFRITKYWMIPIYKNIL
ncbi:exodeoxyribonuclease V subunit gamma [Buchnera aphidicola (Periphyllus koelreuteriae)]|uniref:exodeoxyribonuclease V subunit gamma n=1 Tax=Buchnera aphidicola TaxID=9 RepID=UPI0031B89E5E